MRTLLLSLAVVLLAGCETMARFHTDPHSVFHGTITGNDSDSFIRRGFPPGTTLDLTFDPDMTQGPVPGAISAIAPDGTAYFAATELRVIESLEHDPLSQYDFPGTGRTRNYIYDARPDAGPLAGRDVMAFVSLMDDGSIEVRLVSGTGDEARGDVFGLFHLVRMAR